jgi:hypothetical protein
MSDNGGAETPEVHDAIKACVDLLEHEWDQQYYCTVPEWWRLMRVWTKQCTQTTVREFEEHGQDSGCIKMRMLAIWEADQAMRDGISSGNTKLTCSPKKLCGWKQHADEGSKGFNERDSRKRFQGRRTVVFAHHAPPGFHREGFRGCVPVPVRGMAGGIPR